MTPGSETIEEEGTLPGSGVTLFRRTVRPAGAARARLALCHGYGEHSGRHLHFLRWLAGRGVETHALDLRGHGRSTGRRGYVTRWEEYLEDLQVLLEGAGFGERDAGHSPLPSFVLGHSHGGLIAAAAGIEGLSGVDGVIFSAPYLHSRLTVPRWKQVVARSLSRVLPGLTLSSGLLDEWMTSDPEMIRDSRADPLLVRGATARWYVTAHRKQEEVLARAAEFRLPLLALIGDLDPICDPRAVRDFCDRAGSPDTSCHVIPGLLHELLRESAREEVFRHVLEWIRARAPRAAV